MMEYKNPIIPGYYPDPSICKGKDGYYLVNSSFEYLPGVPLFYSRNLIDWKQIGYCLHKSSQIDILDSKCSGGVFAPTIRYYHDVYYMITTNITKGNFFVTSQNPESGWSQPIFLEPRIEGIDPSLYFEDGHAYVQLASFKEQGILQFEINTITGELMGEAKLISKGCGGRDVEAPHMYKIHGIYYLMCAEGGTRDGHMVTIQKSESLWGPFVSCPNNPILTNRDQARQVLQGVGHGDLIEDEVGEWWMVCHGYRPVRHKHILGRETLLLPVVWKKQWPVIWKGYAETNIVCTRVIEREVSELSGYCNFMDECLPIEFNSVRAFPNCCCSLNERLGYLRLIGNKASLSDEKPFAMIGRRQQHIQFESYVSFDLSMLNKGECGLSIYMDTRHHIELVIMPQQNGYAIFVKKQVGEIIVKSNFILVNEHSICLGIKGSQETYEFYYGLDERDLQLVDWTYTSHVSTEVADSPFTGVYIGMYAIYEAIVDVAWFSYRGNDK